MFLRFFEWLKGLKVIKELFNNFIHRIKNPDLRYFDNIISTLYTSSVKIQKVISRNEILYVIFLHDQIYIRRRKG